MQWLYPYGAFKQLWQGARAAGINTDNVPVVILLRFV